MLTIPVEVFLDILHYLRKDCESPYRSMTILNLAMTCRGLHNVIESWAASETRQDFQTLSKLCSKDNSSPPSPLSILCRRLGNVCMFCSNRARRSSAGELFTHLPLYRACEARKVPKISNINLDRLYIISRYVEDFLKTIESRENLDHRIYQWSDIDPMVVNGYLKKKGKQCKPANYHRNIPFNPEEYAEFGFWQLNNDPSDWLAMSRDLPQHFLNETMQTWNIAAFDKYSPILIEVTLFSEFHYRFNYSWEPKPTLQERVAEYASVARHWTARDTWGKRPWRICAFPETPRCSISNPYAQQFHKDMDQDAFSKHQRQCKLRRALIRSYPAILSNPNVWCRCVSMSEFDESISLAKSAQLTQKRIRHYNLDFELLTSLERDDVLLARTARNRNLKPVIYERYFERVDITMRKVAIVSVRKESVEIKLPGPGARVKDSEKVDEMWEGRCQIIFNYM
jgi:hypothetical protein